MVLWERTWVPHVPFPKPFPMILFHLAISELYPFMIKWRSSQSNVSLSSMICCSKLMEPKQWVVGTSYLWWVRSTGKYLTLGLASEKEVEGRGGLMGLNP